MEYPLVVAVVAVACSIVTLILALRKGGWDMPDRLAKMESRLMAAVKEHSVKNEDLLQKTRGELDTAIDILGRQFGETITAMQSKIQHVELYIRDQLSLYVKRDDFLLVARDTKDALARQTELNDRRFDRLEGKIDLIVERQAERISKQDRN